MTGFHFTFVSDTEGQTLQPPAGGLNLTAVEDGTLQTFGVPPAALLSLTVGMQSDLESVPDSSSTLILLAVGLAGMAALRFGRKPSPTQ